VATNIARDARVSPALQTTRAQGLKAWDAAARMPPRAAARTIIAGIRKNHARILVGADAWAIDVAQRVLPARYRSITRRLAARVRR